MLYSFTGDISVIDESTMNELLTQQSFNLAVRGAAVITSGGAGASEYTLSDYYYAMQFTLTATTTIGRIELEVDSDGNGADLVVELRDSAFSTTGSSDGVLLISRTVPHEFIDTTASTISIPICLELTAGTYWIIANKGGDAVNDVELIGEASANGSYPVARRAGTSGAWTTGQNQIHFTIYNNDSVAGDAQLVHEIYSDTALTNNFYDVDGYLSSQQRYIKAVDNSTGIRETMTYTLDSDGYIIGGVLS